MKVGYIRVSREDQHEQLQIDALTEVGCEKFFFDKMSGSGEKTAQRQGLADALDYMREGDTLVVWKLDRLGRSLLDLIQIIQGLEKRGIFFASATQQIDTTTPMGRFFLQVLGAFAEYEREMIRERTNAGLAAARARGRFGGRRKALQNGKVEMAQRLYADKSNSIEQICELLGVSRATLYRYIEPEDQQKVSENI
jgi:DNA invertase Pin-like site-specific DNA recombinase